MNYDLDAVSRVIASRAALDFGVGEVIAMIAPLL